MKHPVITVRPHDSILHARETIEEHRINQLPVTVDGRLVGIVTDRDLRDAFPSVFETATRTKRSAKGDDPAVIPTEDVMSRNVVAMSPADLVVDAARLMRRQRIGAIPVVDGGRVVGILTRSDLLDALVELAGSRAGG
jgi:acetoin utilization protein AcuB